MPILGAHKAEEFEDGEEGKIDWQLILAVILIMVVGFVNIYSATASDATLSGGMSMTTKQLLWSFLGFLIIGVCLLFDYRLIERIGYFLYGLNLFALFLVPLIGVKRYGAKRWLDLGFMNFQPSETMKVVTIIALAKYFYNVGKQTGAMGVKELFIPSLILGLPTLVVMAQPDLGTGGHLAMIGAAILLFVGIKKRILLTLLLLGFVSFPVAWKYGLKSYQKDRIRTFLDPSRDPRGKGFNAIQSMIAVGSGKLVGKGFQQGTQTQLDFTPEEHTDFIFTVLAEEWGFVGAIFLFGLYVWMFQRCVTIASLARDRFGALLGVGIIAMMASQIMINLAMVTGMFPIVGIPLPLVSYGGTSILTMCLAVGLLLNVGYKRTMF